MEAASDAEVRELGFEPTPRGWRRLGVAEELEATGLTPGERRRWAMISVRGWAALPARRARTFAVAASLGKIKRKDGSFNRISNARDALCVVVRPEHRDRVLKVLGGRQARQWQRDVAAWVAVGMAHRCPDQPRGSVSLFFEPQEECPACHASLKRHEVSPLATRDVAEPCPREFCT